MSEAESYPFPALRARITQLAAEGRHKEREEATCQLAELTMDGPIGFNPHRRAPERRVPRLRYPVFEAH
jgi:hypothetical protein